MTGSVRPFLGLAWFEGTVVALGAGVGIVSQSPPVVLALVYPPLDIPAGLFSFIWLVCFALVGWIGWHIHRQNPKSLAFVVWLALVASMLGWRLLYYALGAVWSGSATLLLATILSALLVPLLATANRAASWACLPLLFWLNYRFILAFYEALPSL